MSSARKNRSNRERELDRLHRRLKSPRPDLPILRSAERLRAVPLPTPLPPGEVGQRPGEGLQAHQPPTPNTPPISSPHLRPSASSADCLSPTPSTTPEWTRILPLPADLTPDFRAWLLRHIQTHFNPNPHDTQAQYLAARLALALAHQHLSAIREPDQISPLWLRYEAMADRQFRHALRDWLKHHKENPAQPATSPQTQPPPTPQTPPKPPNATFARTNPIPTLESLFTPPKPYSRVNLAVVPTSAKRLE